MEDTLFPLHPTIKTCPKCGASPVRPFMYGQVARVGFVEGLKDLWRWIRRRPPLGRTCVICWECKEVIGYE